MPPTGPANLSGATGSSPERATIANPAAGSWQAIVSGFAIVSTGERFTLRLAADGQLIK